MVSAGGVVMWSVVVMVIAGTVGGWRHGGGGGKGRGGGGGGGGNRVEDQEERGGRGGGGREEEEQTEGTRWQDSITNAQAGDHPSRWESSVANPHHHFRRITPEQQNNTQVTAQVGGTATLRCYTHYLADEMVTWMKRDKDQLLTVGAQVYSSEARYSVSHSRHQKMWELQVRDVRKSDAGLYECQLTTHPPASLFFWLKVVEARAVIRGGSYVHVATGGRLALHCSVHLATETPAYIFWFHNGTMVNFLPRASLRVTSHSRTSSMLQVSRVRWEDAGTYTCEPHLATPANMTVHVVEGEKHAALHNGKQQEPTDQHQHQHPDSPTLVSSGPARPGHAPSLSFFALIGWCLCLPLAVVQWRGGFGSGSVLVQTT
ncbi:uncharacterized protein LOC126985763 [Eriocheir sinensis]|uniref:uncharacterized protein LOC126985763 n=1 Tax=Eriocheir sinensis TaxID=95602 RepID=UPI0021CA9128|nr:uncharacterized protein LOC126985763 [Eriocheir sinensis]XP_050697052.1 uncharacterized protein LOC126985763 [Eriocheir sinensis]